MGKMERRQPTGFLRALRKEQKEAEGEAALGQGDVSLARGRPLCPGKCPGVDTLRLTQQKPYQIVRKSHAGDSVLSEKRGEVELPKQYWFLIHFERKCGDWEMPMTVRMAGWLCPEGVGRSSPPTDRYCVSVKSKTRV